MPNPGTQDHRKPAASSLPIPEIVIQDETVQNRVQNDADQSNVNPNDVTSSDAPQTDTAQTTATQILAHGNTIQNPETPLSMTVTRDSPIFVLIRIFLVICCAS